MTDEQARLARDLAEMTQERDAISTVFDAYWGDCDELRRERDDARAALERLLTYFDDEPCIGEADGVCGMHGFQAPCAVSVARAVLGQEATR